MIKHNILKRENLVLIVISVICGLLIPFFNISADLTSDYNLEQIFIMARESWIEPGGFHPEIICVIIPLSLFTVFISNSIFDNYDIVKNYIFIRLGNTKKWFLSNSVLTLILCTMSSVFYNIGMLSACLALGFKMTDIKAMASIVIYSIFGIAIITYIITTASTAIAFFTSIKGSVFISIFILVSSLVVSCLLPVKATKYLWTSHYFEYWHNPHSPIMFLLNGNTIYENNNTTSFAFSIIFLLITSIVVNIVSYYLINKSDYI